MTRPNDFFSPKMRESLFGLAVYTCDALAPGEVIIWNGELNPVTGAPAPGTFFKVRLQATAESATAGTLGGGE